MLRRAVRQLPSLGHVPTMPTTPTVFSRPLSVARSLKRRQHCLQKMNMLSSEAKTSVDTTYAQYSAFAEANFKGFVLASSAGSTLPHS